MFKMKYRINVKTLYGDILKFNAVESYEVIDGFLVFTDVKTNQTKRFAVSNCELEEVDDGN